MEPIKISVDVNLNISDDAKAFFIGLLSGTACKPAIEDQFVAKKIVTETAATNTETKKTVATTSKTTAKAEVAEKAKVAEKVKDEEAANDSTEEISIEVLREILAEKINDNRVVIKEKLTEFGCKSISTLDTSKYSEMWHFLNEL